MSPGVGDALVSYDSTTHLLKLNISFSGLEGNTTAAHIHCCVAPNGTAGVATPLPAFPGFPLGVTSGNYIGSLDLTQAASFNPAFVASHGGTLASAEAALTEGLAAGMAYLNLHTTAHGGGEIRAFLSALTNAPSLSFVGLVILAMLLSVVGFRWARRI